MTAVLRRFRRSYDRRYSAANPLANADTGIAVTSLVRGFLVPVETAVLNAAESSIVSSALHFAHVVSGQVGGAAYSTVIGVTNLATTVQTITISFYPEPVGDPITVQRDLSAGGAFRESANSIFGLPSGFSDGWVKISSHAAITGFVAYADTVSGGLAVVPPEPSARGSLLFAHVAGAPVWYTGIALLNASNLEANVEVSVPLFGLQLFGGAGGKLLSNIVRASLLLVIPSTRRIRFFQYEHRKGHAR